MAEIVSLAFHRYQRQFAATDPVRQVALYVFSEQALPTPPLLPPEQLHDDHRESEWLRN